MDTKVQWKEIEKMKAGTQIMPVLLRDDDSIHAEICRTWLNSDEGDDYQQSNPQVWQAVYQHLLQHIQNAAIAAQVKAAVALAPKELEAVIGAQLGQPVQAEQPQPKQSEPQAGQRGGQIPA
jgi:hypothetical protein